jgi:hypothetical protein
LDPLLEKFADAFASAQALRSSCEDIAAAIAALRDPDHYNEARKLWRKLVSEIADITIEADEKALY